MGGGGLEWVSQIVSAINRRNKVNGRKLSSLYLDRPMRCTSSPSAQILVYCGKGIRGNIQTKRRPGKYCTYIELGGLTVWKQRHICELAPHACAVMPWGGGGLGLARGVAVMMPLQGSPQASRWHGGLIWTALGGDGRAERRWCRERWRGVQKHLAVCQGKTVPGAVLLVAAG